MRKMNNKRFITKNNQYKIHPNITIKSFKNSNIQVNKHIIHIIKNKFKNSIF